MKSKAILMAMSLAFFGNVLQAQITQNTENQSVEKQKTPSIQQQIQNAFYQSFALQNTQNLDNLEIQITENQPDENLKNYWISYLNFHKSIFYLQSKNKPKAQEFLSKSLEILQSTKNKNADDYALLANIRSFSFVFLENQNEAMKIDSEVKSYLQKGFKLDKENPQLLAVAGAYDAQTPKEYGGGKKAENYLLKVISSNKSLAHNDLPSWGKSQAYEHLTRLYIIENQKDKARKILEQFKRDFPNHHALSQLETKIK